jgi:protein-S-isoprenylcysteine O-methyltransferase Ste14
VVCLGLFCLVAGLFLAAGFKESLLPRVVAIGGVVFLVVGGVASAIASRRLAASGK